MAGNDDGKAKRTAKKVVKNKSQKARKPVKIKKIRGPLVREAVATLSTKEVDVGEWSSLFLHLTGTSGTIETNFHIPSQTIIFNSMRVHFSSLTNSQTYNDIGIVLDPFFSPVQLNTNYQMEAIPIMGDFSRVDVTTYPNIKMTLAKIMPQRFKYKIIRLSTGETVPNDAICFIQISMSYVVGLVF